MFAEAFAGLASAFPEVFRPAVARWEGAPVFDAGGSITTPGVPVELPCRVQFDAATQAMRLAEGFLESDVRALVLDLDVLNTTARLVDGGDTWALLSVTRDPASVGWECQARRL